MEGCRSHNPPSSAALSTSIQALGRGFDVTSDARLLYCKGTAASGSPLVEIDERRRDLAVGDGLVLPGVSVDVDWSPEKGGRESTRVCSFLEMAEYFNRKSGISGTTPLGCFNAMFNFTGSLQADSASTKSLVMDGAFLPICTVHLLRSNLVLKEAIKRSVPQAWDPPALASFIENFGTHVITSITIGGRDVIYVKQHQASSLSGKEIMNYVKAIGDQRFLNSESQPTTIPLKYKDKVTDPSLFTNREIHPQISGVPSFSGKEELKLNLYSSHFNSLAFSF